MLFLKSWLKDYINLDNISDLELAAKITKFSMEVEEISTVTDYFDGMVVIGKVESLKPVEGSNKLKVFDVNLGNRKIQIVSAAPNVVENMYVAVALHGAKLPNGINIAERKMMGYLTQGMCIGKSEICLEEAYSKGLWDLEEEFKIQNSKFKIEDSLGRSVCEIFPELFPQDVLFDIKVLPDKMGILANHLGIALEIALIYGDFNLLTNRAKTFMNFDSLSAEFKLLLKPDLDNNNLSFEDKIGYSKFFSLHNLHLPKSLETPTNVALRLFLIKQNAVSALVDISNYLIFDIGQPTHFFSVSKLNQIVNSQKINISIEPVSKPVEFKGLGQLKQTTLAPGLITICVNQNSIIIPGISGGQDTMVSSDETELYLELACFEPEMVAKNSFNLGFQRSQATRTFSGGVHPVRMLICFIQLKHLLGENVLLKSLLFAFKNKSNLSVDNFLDHVKTFSESTAELDLNYLSKRSSFDSDKILEKLSLLGSVVSDNSSKLTFKPNKLVCDFELQEEILGDIARLNGLDNIPPTALNINLDVSQDLVYKPFRILKNLITKLGFTETVNRPFVSAETLKNIGKTEAESLLILNPIRTQEPYCRTGLLESFILTVKRNTDFGFGDLDLFELNKIYVPNPDLTKGVQEKLLLGLITTNLKIQDLTTVMHEIATRIYQPLTNFEPSENQLAKNGYTATADSISVEIIQLSASLKKKFDLPLQKNINYLEFDLTNWNRRISPYEKYREDREYPDLKRSLSIFIPKNVTFEEIRNQITELVSKTNPDLELIITGLERLNDDKNSNNSDILNISLKLNNSNSTISGTDADKLEQLIISHLQGLYPSIARR